MIILSVAWAIGNSSPFRAFKKTEETQEETSITASWRYKMTVVIDTPEGEKIGSAVREVTVRKGVKVFAESQASVKLRGEAVVIDLGKRGSVFALLHGYRLGKAHGTDLPGHVFKSPAYPRWLSVEGIKYLRDLKAPPIELDPNWYPVMVRFLNPADPNTVENLIESTSCADEEKKKRQERHDDRCFRGDYFEAAFGKGVRIKQVTIEMADEPVTSKILAILPWLPDYYSVGLDGNKYDYQLAQKSFVHSLSAGAFINRGAL